MTTHTTLSAAREFAAANHGTTILEIEHAAEGRCYIACKANLALMQEALRRKPMAEIVRLIAEHDIKSEEDRAAERREYLATKCRCERCGVEVDGNTCYSQTETARMGKARIKVQAYYCQACETYLKMVGAGEQTDMQNRAAAVPSYESETKSDD